MAIKAVLSEAEYLRTSFPGVDQEFHDGELVERTMPDLFHSEVQSNLSAFFRTRKGTHRTFSYSELRLKVRHDRVMIPDVAVFWPDKPTEAFPTNCPFIAIEILSPDDRMAEVRNKLQEYVDWGVAHVWLIDPHMKRLYLCKDGLHEVPSYELPEIQLSVTPSDLFD
ncbi:MAG: Uma2 family endonuclease [Bryobacteraceae bacterium]